MALAELPPTTENGIWQITIDFEILEFFAFLFLKFVSLIRTLLCSLFHNLQLIADEWSFDNKRSPIVRSGLCPTLPLLLIARFCPL